MHAFTTITCQRRHRLWIYNLRQDITQKKSTENCAGQIKQLLGSKFAAKKQLTKTKQAIKKRS